MSAVKFHLEEYRGPANTIEAIHVELLRNEHKWLLMANYRPPSQSPKSYTENAVKALDSPFNNFENMILLGDLNFNMLVKEKSAPLTELCDIFDLTNMVTEPTCFPKKTAFFERCSGWPQSKDFWPTIKPFLSKGSANNLNICLLEDGNVVNDTVSFCNIFNDHFTNIANDIGRDPSEEEVQNHKCYQDKRACTYWICTFCL